MLDNFDCLMLQCVARFPSIVTHSRKQWTGKRVGKEASGQGSDWAWKQVGMEASGHGSEWAWKRVGMEAIAHGSKWARKRVGMEASGQGSEWARKQVGMEASGHGSKWTRKQAQSCTTMIHAAVITQQTLFMSSIMYNNDQCCSNHTTYVLYKLSHVQQ